MNEWIPHKYGQGATMTFNNFNRISVHYDSSKSKDSIEPRFICTVNQQTLKKRFDDFEEAQQYALNTLKHYAQDVIDDIKENQTNG